ncbi:hypothetical protein [Aquabacterium sp.]|uniref:hypothetical protein n=1 Tax=Aquabacterium sp. TaxID=1872578 RepID=UPI0025C0C778|nr:hypothetical protein [Aquabacterium sp.]
MSRAILRIEQGWSPSCEDRSASEAEWGVLKSGCVNGGVFRESEHKALPGELSPMTELEVRTGDILMCRASGSIHLIGSVAKIGPCRAQLMFSDKTYRITIDEQQLNSDFFVLMMQAKVMRDQIELSVSGADGLANNIPQSSVRAYHFICPPLKEQVTIVSYLAGKVQKLAAGVTQITAAIMKLQEYRTALITAAVTGQIDVRHISIPEPA